MPPTMLHGVHQIWSAFPSSMIRFNIRIASPSPTQFIAQDFQSVGKSYPKGSHFGPFSTSRCQMGRMSVDSNLLIHTFLVSAWLRLEADPEQELCCCFFLSLSYVLAGFKAFIPLMRCSGLVPGNVHITWDRWPNTVASKVESLGPMMYFLSPRKINRCQKTLKWVVIFYFACLS